MTMSTLWTPDGEHEVPRESTGSDQTQGPPDGGQDTEATAEPELTAEQQEHAKAMARELAEARARILETDAATVVANHAFGIYELAAIHLTADEPELSEARLAVDALAALVKGLSGRLGDAEPTLSEALQQAQLLFVQRSQAATTSADTDN